MVRLIFADSPEESPSYNLQVALHVLHRDITPWNLLVHTYTLQ